MIPLVLPTNGSHHRHGLDIDRLLIDGVTSSLDVGDAIHQDAGTSHGGSTRRNTPRGMGMGMGMGKCIGGRDAKCSEAGNSNSSTEGNR